LKPALVWRSVAAQEGQAMVEGQVVMPGLSATPARNWTLPSVLGLDSAAQRVLE